MSQSPDPADARKDREIIVQAYARPKELIIMNFCLEKLPKMKAPMTTDGLTV